MPGRDRQVRPEHSDDSQAGVWRGEVEAVQALLSAGADVEPDPGAVDGLGGGQVARVGAGKFHSVALGRDGAVWTWGWGRGGRLGHPEAHIHGGSSAVLAPRRVALPATLRVLGLAAGKHHTLLRGEGGEAARPVATAIAAGAAHSCALTASGVVLCWRSADPLLQAREVGGALAGRHVVHVAAGKYRTAAVTRDGSVFCWEGRADYFPAGARNAREGKRRAAGVAVGEGAQRGRPVQVGPHARVLGSSPLGTSPTGRSLGSAHAPQAGSYMERFAAGRQHGRAPNGASLHEGAGGSAPRRGDSSPLLGTSPGSSPGPARLLGTPGNAGVGAAGAEGDAPPEILPERVNRLPGATAVAVGEKHTLALHEWYTLELPDADGDGGSGGGCTERKGADACRGAPAALGAAGETAGGEADPPVGAESGDALGAARATCPGAPGAPTPSSRDVASSPAQGGEGEESSTARGPPPLQHLCERLVGAAYVTPASALRVLGTADSMGARLLRAHALSVALGSLRACLAADAAGLARLPPHVLAEMGAALRAADPLPTPVPLGAGSPPSFRAAGEALEEAARARLARTLAKKLQQWYVPEEAVAPVRSMAAIQKEEHAMKELARLYGAGNVRMAPSRRPGAE
ncbi:E3 ubiquitin-protein ligase HERC2 [Auxenochlorella protothecoides]|uniref:E3 ubiquitin-protein ligase HERC2 n=1 Tax=Auxenochlorella protothecoides TaxID=3075 RepID=A0A087SPJ3_AUXPR|nr:E3 ubiquitin-protein ligase HERC2 [Auxenochlorella protothecoides]KFM27647.1 E3 ubiquitin-protein ligase HERC2 [Auxenochlorella protothecoides]